MYWKCSTQFFEWDSLRGVGNVKTSWYPASILWYLCSPCSCFLTSTKHSESALYFMGYRAVAFRSLKWTGTWCVQYEDILALRFYSLRSESVGVHKQSSRSSVALFLSRDLLEWTGIPFMKCQHIRGIPIRLFGQYSDCWIFWKRPERFGRPLHPKHSFQRVIGAVCGIPCILNVNTYWIPISFFVEYSGCWKRPVCFGIHNLFRCPSRHLVFHHVMRWNVMVLLRQFEVLIADYRALVNKGEILVRK